MSTPTDDPSIRSVPDREPGRVGEILGFFSRSIITFVIAITLIFLIGPVIATFVASFASNWTGVLPSGFITLQNWEQALGLQTTLGATRGLGGIIPIVIPFTGITIPIPATLGFSAGLALGGVLIDLVIGIPIAYAVTRYDFIGRDWLNTLAVLPVVPGIILGIAFLRTYPNMTSWVTLMIGYSLLKAPYMVLAVQSSFESMDLRQLEESARSLGASWTRTVLTIIIPNASRGIISGAIITWTLAAAEFNFSFIIYSRGPKPLSLFLYENITNNPFLRASAAISIYFLLILFVTLLLQATGNRGFELGGRQ